MKQKRWGDNNEQNDFARVHVQYARILYHLNLCYGSL